MRKLRFLLMAVLMMLTLTGCAYFDSLFTPGNVDQNALASAKLAGKLLANKNPQLAKGAAMVYATGLLKYAKEGKVTPAQLQEAADALVKELGKEKIQIYVDAFFIFLPPNEIKLGEPNAKLILYLEAFIEGMAL